VYGGWEGTRPAPRGLILAQVYAISCTGLLRRFNGPELSRWLSRSLIEARLVPTPDLTLAPLPPEAPEAALATWAAVGSLLRARALTEKDGGATKGIPLVASFLARWAATKERTIRTGKTWLEHHGYIKRHGHLVHDADAPPQYGKAAILWTVRLLQGDDAPMGEHEFVAAIVATFDAVEAVV
jgi:hypothetical protein